MLYDADATGAGGLEALLLALPGAELCLAIFARASKIEDPFGAGAAEAGM